VHHYFEDQFGDTGSVEQYKEWLKFRFNFLAQEFEHGNSFALVKMRKVNSVVTVFFVSPAASTASFRVSLSFFCDTLMVNKAQ